MPSEGPIVLGVVPLLREVAVAPECSTLAGSRRRFLWDHRQSLKPLLLPKGASLASKRAAEMRWIEAVDMAHRFGARVPDWHEDEPRALLWIGRIERLPLAQQQGRLAAAIDEANRYAGPPDA